MLNSQIRLKHYPNFLTKKTCAELIQKHSKEQLFHRTRSIQEGVSNKLTSSCKFLQHEPDINYDIWRTGVKEMISHEVFPRGANHSPMMLKYEKHQYVTKHYDCLTPEEVYAYDKNYQHLFSFIIYLNDDYEGGELVFDKLNLKIKPQAGDAYMWCNIVHEKRDGYYIPNMLSQHRSLPIRRGTKYNIVKFFT